MEYYTHYKVVANITKLVKNYITSKSSRINVILSQLKHYLQNIDLSKTDFVISTKNK